MLDYSMFHVPRNILTFNVERVFNIFSQQEWGMGYFFINSLLDG